MDRRLGQEVLLRAREMAALMLWDIGAVKVNLDEPFRLVSGNYSPIYINCRLAISYPSVMKAFVASAGVILEHNRTTVDVVAGGETAGIPFAAFLASSLSCPLIYVRKATKDHGLSSLVEGHLPADSVVLLVEDLITDAGSKLHFIEAIRACGARVEDALVLLDREQGGEKSLSEHGVRLASITDMSTLLRVAESERILPNAGIESIHEYLRDPRTWHSKHNLTFVGQ